MLRVVLITLGVLVLLRLFARLSAALVATPREPEDPPRPSATPKPRLSAAQRAELEAERERALREGRQIDAIKIHRQLTGLGR